MFFYHIADVHLGATPDKDRAYSDCRRQEIWDTFRRIIEEAGREEPDCLFLCGDLFHRQPLKRELKEVDYLFSGIPKTMIFLMAGNHDCVGKGSAYREFPWNRNVYFFDNEKPKAVRIKLSERTADACGEKYVTVYGHSYMAREIREPLYDSLYPGIGEGFHVLMGHGGDVSHIPMDFRRIGKAGFDYVALGHIHRPQILEGGVVAYAGAPEPLEVNDIGEHGFVKGRLFTDPVTGEHQRKLNFVNAAKRSYVTEQILLNPSMTGLELEDQVQHVISAGGSRNLFRLILTGSREPEWEPNIRRLLELGNVAEVKDESRPEWDFDALRATYRGHLIGQFLESYEEKELTSSACRSRIYGLEALLEASGGKV